MATIPADKSVRLDGMTVNERLFEFGLIDAFDAAVNSRNREQAYPSSYALSSRASRHHKPSMRYLQIRSATVFEPRCQQECDA